MAKVRKFNLDMPTQADAPPPPVVVRNVVPDLPREAVERVAATASVQIRQTVEAPKPGNPRERRYRLKTYSLLQEDIENIEALLASIRGAGVYERGRGDIVRAGIKLMLSLPLDEQVRAVEAVEKLR